MAELNFPANPQIDDEYIFNNLLYKYDGEKWTTWGSGANTALDLKNDLASNTGASMIGTLSGMTVQDAIDMSGSGASTVSLEPLRRSYADAGFNVDISKSFTTGAVLTAPNQVLLGAGQIGYSWGGTFPKEVPPNSSPADSGGIGSTAWIDQSNNLLRAQAKNYIDAADANLQGQLNSKADIIHTHTIADVSGLQSALDDKSGITHTHTPESIGAVNKAGDTMLGILNAPDFYVTSDARLKSNLVPLTGALAMLAEIQGYYYDKALYLGNAPIKHEAGVIAQEVEAVFPVAVTKEGSQDIRTVSQSAMIALLLEAIKELQAQVASILSVARVARTAPPVAPAAPVIKEVKL